MEHLLLLKIFSSLALLCVCILFLRLYNTFVLNPERLRSQLRKQGIGGPPPSLLYGNIPEMKKIQSTVAKAPKEEHVTHDCASILFPFFEQWRKKYGEIFMFSIGNLQLLGLTHPDVVKEMSTCISLDLGKPAYQQKKLGALLGQGILTSNGALWAHQRKIIAPEFYMDKVKGMINLMVESAISLLKSWENRIESEGGLADIRVDDDMRNFSGDVISRVCFGSNFTKGEEIFSKLKSLQKKLASRPLSMAFPGLRYLPTKGNREIWRLEKEIRSLILKMVKERKEATCKKDLLQMILEDSANNTNKEDLEIDTDRFIVDNCKNIYQAGYETTAVSATWILMLLASHPEWQADVRAEVLEVCRGQMPDTDMLGKMKMLTMVIHEALRLYPPVTFIPREVLQDMMFGGVNVPKGVNLWIMVLALHLDPEIWGPDATKFNPYRFAQGTVGACKRPNVYMPFGVGPRVCLGQQFAIVELKIIISLILSKFSFSLSPKYRHSPAHRLVIEPEHGLNLLMKSLN